MQDTNNVPFYLFNSNTDTDKLKSLHLELQVNAEEVKFLMLPSLKLEMEQLYL